MVNSAKYIITYLTIFSLLFSSLGITIYYHHCNKEQITLTSISGKIDCTNPQFDLTNHPQKDCCHNDQIAQNHCNNNKTKTNANPGLIIDSISCCNDNQFVNKISEDFVGNSKQNIKENQITKQNQFQKNQPPTKNILNKIKENLNKNIIQPIKKFISLIQQIAQLINQSEKDNDEDSSLY